MSTTETTPATVTKAAMLAEFDRVVSEHWQHVYPRIAAYLPPTFGDVDSPRLALEAQVITHLHGARRALARWNPHPAIAPAEWPKLQELIAELVEGAVNMVFTHLQETMDHANAEAGSSMNYWSERRPVNRAPELVHVEDKPRFRGHWEIVDGKKVFFPPANVPSYRTLE